MRLLNTKTLQLKEFYEKIPPYAVLSHTWGASDDEVTFQEICNLNAKIRAKPGFKKIEECAAQARRDELPYCWVDTCCIDKTSSAELSEAINSMFRWYANSTVCYIYLADVKRPSRKEELWDLFEGSRWFSRGWTLQELIAPRERIFFDKSWRVIGYLPEREKNLALPVNGFYRGPQLVPGIQPDSDADDGEPGHFKGLVGMMSIITGISEGVLQTGRFQNYPTCTKMSWASQRKTTRTEDMAYCLMGIFDVNMPLLYGEGDKAFIRLQEEILKKRTDHSIFAWRGLPDQKLPFFYGLLAPSPRNFYSRPDYTIVPQIRESQEMVNNELRMELTLFSHKDLSLNQDNEYLALLGIKLDGTHRTCISLRELNSNGQYARIDPNEPIDNLHTRWKPNTKKVKMVSVKQNINDIPADPDLVRLSRVVFRNDLTPDLTVTIHSIKSHPQMDEDKLVLPWKRNTDMDVRICFNLGHPGLGRGIEVGWQTWSEQESNGVFTRFCKLQEKDKCTWDDGEQWTQAIIVEQPSKRQQPSDHRPVWGGPTGFIERGIRPLVDFTMIQGELVAEVSLDSYTKFGYI